METQYFFYNGKALIWEDGEQNTDAQVFTEEEIIEAFANTLHEIRTTANISTTGMAKEIGIPQQTLSAYELNKNTPSLLQAIRICAYFECSIEDFILYGLGIGGDEIVEKFRQKIEFERENSK